MSISLTTVGLSTELLKEKVVLMDPCDNAGQPDEVPFVVGYADDEDEEDEEDVDDLDEDEDQKDEEDEELDDEGLDYEWEEVVDEDEEEDE